MPDTPPAIELAGVDVTGAELRADTVMIHDVNWSVNPGEYWVVAGFPGSGKTDLLTTAAGLQRPGCGTHLLFGTDLSHLEEGEQLRQRLRAGMVFQGGRLFHQHTVVENLALPLCYHQNLSLDDVRDRVHAVLEAVDLPGLERKRPRHLTRNLLQRVALARALMLAPDVLLIDNPLIGMDPRQARWWLGFLPRLVAGLPLFEKRPMTLVIATDDLGPWRTQNARFAVVHDKKFSILGDRNALESTVNPMLRDLWQTEFKRQET